MTEQRTVTIRFYAAAAEAAGTAELQIPVPAASAPTPLRQLLAEILEQRHLQRNQQRHRQGLQVRPGQHDGEVLDLQRVCARSSFLVNALRVDPEVAHVRPGDLVDVLPPFAGG